MNGSIQSTKLREVIKIERLTFDDAVDNYADLVTQIAMLHLNNVSDTEDCWQEVFLALFQHPEVLDRGRDAVRYWLVRVTINRCYDMNRYARYREHLMLEDADLMGVAHRDSYPAEVLDLLRAIPEKYRAPIFLYYCRGYSVKEVARILSRRENTVKTQLRRGKELLKGELELEEN